MSHYHQNQNQPQAYPPSSTAAYPATGAGGLYVAPPPPAGYPTGDGQAQFQNHPPPGETRSRGDGFWKGCCAGLCCCCLLDACF